jgi:2-polyprenyl-6-methoxyphenol hydroxylase-like FAD-dependent oxidoreductase
MKVIIAGSGPAGLVLAHCLLKAGIDDFVILERRKNPIDETGAGLGLWPHTVRILDQLGLLDEARKRVPEVKDMKRSVHLDPKGGIISESELFRMIAEK